MVNSSGGPKGRIVVLGTGGTIAGRAAAGDDNVGYVAGEVGVAEIVQGVESPPGHEVTTEQIVQLDSKDMDFAAWQLLARRCATWLQAADVVGLVITHGTDTLEETAFFLQAVLAPVKPVVLTCAMRPSTSLAPDGPQNVRDAMAVASAIGARGVSVVCAGVVHGAVDVRKTHTYRLDAFGSGDAGPVGYVEEGRVRRMRDWPDGPPGQAERLLARMLALDPSRWPVVQIVTSHAGADGSVVDALMQSGSARPHGLVIAATGNGTVHARLEAAARRAQEEGVSVVRATRCPEGTIVESPGDGEPGAVRSAGPLSPVKARIALMLELMDAAGSAT
jgi:L-asparaginase